MVATPPTAHPHVVIIGGGAGGLELAIRLTKEAAPGGVKVTLIDRYPSHVWKPRLHEIATGLLMASDEEAGFAEQAARHGFCFVLGEMTALDPVNRSISLSPVPPPDDTLSRQLEELLPARSISYDIAVLSIGSTVNDFGIAGVNEHCFTLDTATGAEKLQNALLSLAARVKAGLAQALRVAIVGAGTTGVELAGELRQSVKTLDAYRSLIAAEQLQIVLIEMAERPLPGTDRKTSDSVRHGLEAQSVEMRFGVRVQEVAAGRLLLSDHSQVDADLIVWASGIQGQQIVKHIAGLRVGKGGRIDVDARLQALSAEGRSLESLYCIGDCAAFYAEGSTSPLGATAQVAEQQARFLARSLAASWRGKPLQPFRYRDRGTVVSLGGRLAFADLFPGRNKGSFRLDGSAAKIAYSGLYRAHLASLFGWWRATLLTLSRYLRRSAMPTIKLPW